MSPTGNESGDVTARLDERQARWFDVPGNLARAYWALWREWRRRRKKVLNKDERDERDEIDPFI